MKTFDSIWQISSDEKCNQTKSKYSDSSAFKVNVIPGPDFNRKKSVNGNRSLLSVKNEFFR